LPIFFVYRGCHVLMVKIQLCFWYN